MGHENARRIGGPDLMPRVFDIGRESRLRHFLFGSTPTVAAGVELSFGNHHEGVALTVALDPPAPSEWFPVETVSNSEAGFERVYQGSCLTQRWPLRLTAGDSTIIETTFRFTQSRDRSSAETT